MAQTIEQWNAKVKKFVPGWHFEQEEGLDDAFFYAVAAVFQQIQQDTDDAQASSFILRSPGPVLDLHGDERGIKRATSELDGPYSTRIQNGIFVPVAKAQLQTAIDMVLNNGTAFLIENLVYGYYDDPDNDAALYFDDYFSRMLDNKKWFDWWTVIIPLQTSGDQNAIRAAIVNTIEANKALGTTYDVLYESSDDTDPND